MVKFFTLTEEIVLNSTATLSIDSLSQRQHGKDATEQRKPLNAGTGSSKEGREILIKFPAPEKKAGELPKKKAKEKPKPSVGVKQLNAIGRRRFEALGFLVNKRGKDLKMKDAQYFARLQKLFSLDAVHLLKYLNDGKITERHCQIFRDAVVKIWASLSLHNDREVDWSFLEDQLGTQGLRPLLCLDKPAAKV